MTETSISGNDSSFKLNIFLILFTFVAIFCLKSQHGRMTMYENLLISYLVAIYLNLPSPRNGLSFSSLRVMRMILMFDWSDSPLKKAALDDIVGESNGGSNSRTLGVGDMEWGWGCEGRGGGRGEYLGFRTTQRTCIERDKSTDRTGDFSFLALLYILHRYYLTHSTHALAAGNPVYRSTQDKW